MSGFSLFVKPFWLTFSKNDRQTFHCPIHDNQYLAGRQFLKDSRLAASWCVVLIKWAFQSRIFLLAVSTSWAISPCWSFTIVRNNSVKKCCIWQCLNDKSTHVSYFQRPQDRPQVRLTKINTRRSELLQTLHLRNP